MGILFHSSVMLDHKWLPDPGQIIYLIGTTVRLQKGYVMIGFLKGHATRDKRDFQNTPSQATHIFEKLYQISPSNIL